jgi:hypothetical protein|nr:MAG TPA: hypothetical protein [Caudoviricetes sp.]DAQ40472.1 MAG TPA: hypothetical protein [Caudoviricetes sp.]
MNTITQMQLTQKLLAMAAVFAAGLPQRQTNAHPRFNRLRTVNSYGEFVWQICRRKGHPVAVISRNGRHYCDLELMPGFGSRSMHDDVTEFVMDVLCTEAGRMEEGSE